MAQPLVLAQISTPFGPLAVFARPEDQVVLASGFASVERIAASLPAPAAARGWEPGTLPSIEREVVAWLAGDADALGRVAVEQPGGPFVTAAWKALSEVPFGEVVSYSELAVMAGKPRAARAAGTACATNRVAPFVPCHRVVKSGGAVGNYGYGVDLKERMLAMEREAVAATAVARVG